ncbi:hypothetical protein HRG84_13445 [Flavisolibacter sp. BT320]|nr:hypothetical protein [Flavisolibacter longurius]
MTKLVLFITFCTFFFSGNAQTTIDKSDTGLQNSIKSINALKEQTNKLQAAVQELKDKDAEFSSQNFHELDDNTLKWILVSVPIILMILVLLFVSVTVGRKIDIKGALSENSHPKKTIKNPEYSAAMISTIGGSIQNLPMLFPTTIEVSASWPSLNELIYTSKSKEDQKSKAFRAFTAADEEYKKAEEVEKQARENNNRLTTNESKKALDDAEKRLIKAKTHKSEMAESLETAKKEELDALKAIEQKIKWLEVGKENSYQTDFSPKPSISRFIALITILAIIVFVTCMSCFFIYHYIRTSRPPNFSAMTAVIIALCLGVTPYIANQIAASIAAKRT